MSRCSGVGYHVERMSSARRLATDLLRFGSHQPTIHALVEADVTEARRRIAGIEPAPSFTAFVVSSLAGAVARHPEINARRAGTRLIRFDHVAVGLSIERELAGARFPLPYVVSDADSRSFLAVSDELRAAQRRPVRAAGDLVGMSWLERLPSALRRTLMPAAAHVPAVSARLGPAVGVTAVGMFGHRAGWGIPTSPMTLLVCVGGIGRRLALLDGRPVEREILSVTLSFDHTVIDGGPAARFTEDFVQLLEAASVVPELTATDRGPGVGANRGPCANRA